MALRMGALYDTLRMAQGITDDQARIASEEVAAYHDRIGTIERDLTVLKWMVGMSITLQLITIGGLVGIGVRLLS